MTIHIVYSDMNYGNLPYSLYCLSRKELPNDTRLMHGGRERTQHLRSMISRNQETKKLCALLRIKFFSQQDDTKIVNFDEGVLILWPFL